MEMRGQLIMLSIAEFTCHCFWFYKREAPALIIQPILILLTCTKQSGLTDLRELDTVYLTDIGRLFVLFGSEPYHIMFTTRIGFQLALL